MDSIRINSPFNKNDFIRGQLIKWEIAWRKNRRQLINYSIVSIVVLLIGIVTRTEEEPTNPFYFIGIGFSVATLFLIYLRLLSKQRYNRKVKEIAQKFDSLQMDCTYELSDESIKYWDKEKSLEFKWSLFSHYSIYKNYLILVLNNSLIDCYVFERKESDMEEYNKVLAITKLKLNCKEIK